MTIHQKPVVRDGYLSSDIPDVWILYGAIAFAALVFLWEEYISLRQRGVLRSVERVPSEIKNAIPLKTFDKARLYNLDKSLFGTCHSFFDMITGTWFLLYGMMPLLWSLSGHAVVWFGYTGEIPQSMVFMLYSTVVSTVVSLPWSVYSTFVVEERHGFNKQTCSFYVKDKLKQLVVSQAIGLPVVAAIVYIVQRGGDFFFLYLWAFCCVLMLFIMTVYPEFIAPLFDKYTPLPEGPLRSRIEALAQRLAFPLTKLYVVEGSKRSAHSNAYFYGFFNNKRIVLFDTLLKDWEGSPDVNQSSSDVRAPALEEDAVKKGCTDDEVVAVLSHELGHWSLNHVLKNLLLIQLNLLLTFAAFAALHRFTPLYRAFGFSATRPVLPGLMIIMQHVLAPYSTLFGVLMTRMSRRFEFQADRFGKQLGYASDLKAALVKLTSDNLGFPVYDEWFSAWHHSHPPLLQRLAALEKTD